MNFKYFLMKLLIVDFILCLLAGPAVALTFGVGWYFIIYCKNKYEESKTFKGRLKNYLEYNREIEIEREYGTIDYYTKK